MAVAEADRRAGPMGQMVAWGTHWAVRAFSVHLCHVLLPQGHDRDSQCNVRHELPHNRLHAHLLQRTDTNIWGYQAIELFMIPVTNHTTHIWINKTTWGSNTNSPLAGLKAKLCPWPVGWCSLVAGAGAQRSSLSCHAWWLHGAGSGCGCRGRRRSGWGSAWAHGVATHPWAEHGWVLQGGDMGEEGEVVEGGSPLPLPALWTCYPWLGCCLLGTDPPGAEPELDSRLQTVHQGRTCRGSEKTKTGVQ